MELDEQTNTAAPTACPHCAALAAENAALRAELAALKGDVAEQHLAQLVAEGLKCGAVIELTRDWFTALGRRDIEALRAFIAGHKSADRETA